MNKKERLYKVCEVCPDAVSVECEGECMCIDHCSCRASSGGNGDSSIGFFVLVFMFSVLGLFVVLNGAPSSSDVKSLPPPVPVVSVGWSNWCRNQGGYLDAVVGDGVLSSYRYPCTLPNGVIRYNP